MWQLFWVFFSVMSIEIAATAVVNIQQQWYIIENPCESIHIQSICFGITIRSTGWEKWVRVNNQENWWKRGEKKRESESLLLQYVFNTINLSLRYTMMTIIYDAVQRARERESAAAWKQWAHWPQSCGFSKSFRTNRLNVYIKAKCENVPGPILNATFYPFVCDMLYVKR